MTPNAHEAGKVSDERLATIARGPCHDARGPNIEEIVAIASELRTRRAESQTGAVRDAVQAFASVMNLPASGNPYEDCRRLRIEGTKLLSALEPTPIEETGNDGAECWAGCDDPNCPYIHESAPIKETAEPEHIATDVHSETANAEHVTAVPADVQGVTEPKIVAWRQKWSGQEPGNQYLFFELDPTKTHGRCDPLVRLADYQRLAAENEKLTKRLCRYVEMHDANIRTKRKLVMRERRRAEAAEGKLAEAVKVLEPFAIFADALNESMPDNIAIGIYADGAMRFGPNGGASVNHLRAARTFLASLTSPPTEQGET